MIDSYNYNTLGGTQNPEFSINDVGNKGITIIDLVKTINFDSKIYKYEVFSLIDTKVVLKIWRKEKNGYHVITKSKPKSISYGRTRISLDVPIEVQKGDIVGFYTSNSSLSNEKPLGKSYDIFDKGDVDFISNNKAKSNTGNSGGYSLKIFMDKNFEKSYRSKTEKIEKMNIGVKNNKILKKFDSTSFVTEFIKSINDFNCKNHNNELLSFYCKKYNKKQEFIFDLAINHIIEMSKNSKTLNANFIAFYLTPIYEFYAKDVKNKDIDLSRPYRYLNQKLEQHGIKIYDIHLRSKNDEIFYIPDSHYNENGYKAVAMKILDITRKENIILKKF